MENKRPKIGTFLINALENIRVSCARDKFSKELIHYQLECEKTGISGTGSDYCQVLAFSKAKSELIERLSRLDLQISTKKLQPLSGFACHLSQDLARANALCELIERDVFLTAWFSGKSPYWSFLDKNLFLQDIFKKEQISFKKYNFDLKIGLIGNCMDHYVIVGCLQDLNQRFGCVISTCADKSLDLAVKKVIIDLKRVGTYIFNSFSCNEPLPLVQAGIKESIDHQSHYLDISNFKAISSYINETGYPVELPDFEYDLIDFDMPEAIKESAFVSMCKSEHCQNYFIGKANTTKINGHRINKIGEYCPSRAIHPLG